MIKYIFRLLDHKSDKEIQIIDTLPTRLEVIRFLIGTVYFGISIFLVGIMLMPVLFILDFILGLMVSQGWIESFRGGVGAKIIINISVAIERNIFCISFIIFTSNNSF